MHICIYMGSHPTRGESFSISKDIMNNSSALGMGAADRVWLGILCGNLYKQNIHTLSSGYWHLKIALLNALLTHWGRATHICVGRLTIIGSDNGLSPGRRQAIIWTNAGILLIGPLGTNFSELLIECQAFSLKKIRLKMSSAKYCPIRLGLNVLMMAGRAIADYQPYHHRRILLYLDVHSCCPYFESSIIT